MVQHRARPDVRIHTNITALLHPRVFNLNGNYNTPFLTVCTSVIDIAKKHSVLRESIGADLSRYYLPTLLAAITVVRLVCLESSWEWPRINRVFIYYCKTFFFRDKRNINQLSSS